MFKKIWLFFLAFVSTMLFAVLYGLYDAYIGIYNFGAVIIASVVAWVIYRLFKNDDDGWNRTFHCMECDEEITYPSINFQWSNGIIPSCHFHSSDCSLADNSLDDEEDHSGFWVFWGTFLAWAVWVAMKGLLI